MAEIITPPYLEPGDKVAIVAPAGKVDPVKQKIALEIISSWGFEVVEGKNLFKTDGYFAGTDEQRLEDLQNMVDDPSVKAIFCYRGGYGLTRIIDRLQLDKFLETPKWVVGFSDITALHLLLSLNNVESIHGIMPALFAPEEARPSIKHLHSALLGQVDNIEWDYNKNNIPGSAFGYLRGGNLSIISDCIGTSSFLHGEDTILFIEEIDEYLYKIDRMLIHLKRSGVLGKVKGLIIGYFTSVKDTPVPFGASLEDLILQKVSDLNIPVAFGLPSGHEDPNLSLIHNRQVTLEVNNDKSKLTF
jgi:muramoyltetrapeptide carboxypeptidase